MVVHLTGRPAKMNEINSLAKKYNLFVKPRKFKETANNVLLKIQSLGYEVDNLEKYLQRNNLTNKKEAMKFLDELVLRQKKYKK